MSLYDEDEIMEDPPSFDEDIGVPLDDEDMEDQVEAAKSALTKATDNLNRLADYCENSFKEPQVVTNNDNFKGKGLKLCTTLDEVYSGLNNAADRLVVIEFYANWCDRCKLMFSQVEEIANNSPNVNFLKVDVDQNREAVKEFDVHPEFQNPQLPTFILMKNNQRVGEMFGETNAAKLKDLVEKHGAMLFGSQELQETANYTLQALEAVMTGVFNLAEHLTQKTQDLSNTISNLDQEVNYVSALASQYQGKVNFGQLKKSLTVEKADYSRPMYDRDYDLNLEDRYQRLQINYNELDHVGNVYVPNRSKRDSIGSTISDQSGTSVNLEAQLEPNVPPMFYKNEPKETKPKRKISDISYAGSEMSFAGAGTMSRVRKGSFNSRNKPIVTGTLGKNRKKIAMPGTPMPTKPPKKDNDENSDYQFLPPLPDYVPPEPNIMEEMPPPPPPMMDDFDLDNVPPPPPPDLENIPPPPPPSFDQSFEDTQNSLDDLAYQLQNLGQD